MQNSLTSSIMIKSKINNGLKNIFKIIIYHHTVGLHHIYHHLSVYDHDCSALQTYIGFSFITGNSSILRYLGLYMYALLLSMIPVDGRYTNCLPPSSHVRNIIERSLKWSLLYRRTCPEAWNRLSQFLWSLQTKIP